MTTNIIIQPRLRVQTKPTGLERAALFGFAGLGHGVLLPVLASSKRNRPPISRSIHTTTRLTTLFAHIILHGLQPFLATGAHTGYLNTLGQFVQAYLTRGITDITSENPRWCFVSLDLVGDGRF